jgi:DNA-nicking Smr family endonuclease
MPDDKPKISAEDAALFRRSVGEARRLKADTVKHPRKRPRPVPRQRQLDDQQVLVDMMSDAVDSAEVETGDELLFVRTGVQHRTLRKLRRGEFTVHAELDLHRRTAAEARVLLVEFLHRCQANGARCVRIIHGKGHGSFQKKPVLKNKVNSWLQQRDEVLAFCSARPVDGGTGAVYVLLKRR